MIKKLLNFFQSRCAICTPTSSTCNFRLLSILNFSHFSGCVVISLCDFNLHSPLTITYWAFSYAYWLLIYIPLWSVHQVALSMFLIVCLFIIELDGFLKIFSGYRLIFFRHRYYKSCGYFDEQDLPFTDPKRYRAHVRDHTARSWVGWGERERTDLGLCLY